MPKPPQTYARTQAPTKIANQAEQAKLVKSKVDAQDQLRAAAFAAILKKSRLDGRHLAEYQKLAEALKNFGKEPSTKQGVLVKQLGEAADLLKDFAELQAKIKEFNTELGPRAKGFASAHDKTEGTPSAANMLLVAVALIAFIAAIKKTASKFGAKL